MVEHNCPQGIDFDVEHESYLIDESGMRYGSIATVVARCALVPCSKVIAKCELKLTEDGGRILVGYP